MRAALLMLLIALAGCATIRDGLGVFQKTANKGVEAKAGDAPREDKPVLPGGLIGDKANAAYTAPPPQD